MGRAFYIMFLKNIMLMRVMRNLFLNQKLVLTLVKMMPLHCYNCHSVATYIIV